MPDPQVGGLLSRASVAAFHRYFWQPPRAHGDVIEGREVSFLELFYDLVYVVISQAGRHLAGAATWAGVGRFAVVFGLIWLAWINGAVYHDLHGRAEGRTRPYVFLQMGVLTLLAIFTARATGVDGPAFALVYSAYLFLSAGSGTRCAARTTRRSVRRRRRTSRASWSRPPSSELARCCRPGPAWRLGRWLSSAGSPASPSWTGAAGLPGTPASTRASR